MLLLALLIMQIRIDKLTRYLSSVTWDFITNASCINDDYDKFINTVVISVNKYFPVKTYNHAVTTSPWLTLGKVVIKSKNYI